MDIDRLLYGLIFLVISRRARHLYTVSQVLFTSSPLGALHHKYFETMHKVENPVPSTSISLERILAVPRMESAESIDPSEFAQTDIRQNFVVFEFSTFRTTFYIMILSIVSHNEFCGSKIIVWYLQQ